MENLIPVEFDSYPTETHHNTVPVPAEGKKLYISHNSAGIDFQALLGQVVQCVNMGEILAEIKAGTLDNIMYSLMVKIPLAQK